MKKETKAILILSLLSPLFAEVLSGSTPPHQLISEPLSFPSLWAFYGSGVLLFRELWVRKNKTPGGIMMLGFAYGILEEGVFIKSWFDPAWPDLGILGRYGRIMGINTVWAAWLTVFHAFMSIWVPIILFELLFPELRNTTLLERKSAILLLSMYLGMGIVMNQILDNYHPPLIPYSLTAMLAISFIIMGTKFKLPGPPEISEKKALLLGIAYSTALFIIFVLIPHTSIPPEVPIILGIPIAILFYVIQVNQPQKIIHTLMLGALSFWLLFMDFALATMGHLAELPLGWGTYIAVLYVYFKRYNFTSSDKKR
ncbi:hypothetical protein AciM339_1043 [Aciduliprofundum sp. MAR08-339]|uniref:hypothetical protein n=1 Tax=Aciduliprofundum sp. (strain MAR08-339) TaxID=673860 RepID=UPI0002A4B2D7|nr:hypothetical protein AciM339_1043 [Aciduliprofundum sp. MAR08-339]